MRRKSAGAVLLVAAFWLGACSGDQGTSELQAEAELAAEMEAAQAEYEADLEREAFEALMEAQQQDAEEAAAVAHVAPPELVSEVRGFYPADTDLALIVTAVELVLNSCGDLAAMDAVVATAPPEVGPEPVERTVDVLC